MIDDDDHEEIGRQMMPALLYLAFVLFVGVTSRLCSIG